MKLVTFIFAFIFTLAAQAKIEVAFVESWLASGQKVELEKGSRFAHVAIRYNGHWLHASPRHGVELTDDLNLFSRSKIAFVLSDAQSPDPTADEVFRLIGVPYDFKFRWEDSYGTYCSKLVGKLLNIPPSPMHFDGSYWNGVKNLPNGEPGLSPDGLYRELIRRGYISTSFPRKISKIMAAH